MKKPSLKFVEQHTVSWIMNRLEENKRAIDDLFHNPAVKKRPVHSERDIEYMILGTVDDLEQLLELFKPLEYVVLMDQYQYDEDDIQELVGWARDFIDDNDTFCEDSHLMS